MGIYMNELKEFYQYLRVEKAFSKNTTNPYIEIIKRFLKEGYTLENIESFYISFLEKEYGSNYLHNLYYALKYYAEMHNKKFTIKRPRIHIRRRKSMTREDSIVFISVINDMRDKCIVLIGLTTGLRPSEILNLNMEDIDLEKQTIQIRNTKGHRDRIVFVQDMIKPYLKIYLKERERYAKSKAVFTSYRSGRRISLKRVEYLFDKYSKEAGVKCTPHMLRHTFATLFIQNGGDIKILKELLGHRDIKTTERYIHECSEMIREGYRKYAPKF